jgi:hypothetical protein
MAENARILNEILQELWTYTSFERKKPVKYSGGNYNTRISKFYENIEREQNFRYLPL